MTLHPGAAITGGFRSSGTVTAAGTVNDPVTMGYGAFLFEGSPGDTSRLEHVRFRSVRLESLEQHPLVLRQARLDSGSVRLRAAGSGIFDSVLDTGGHASPHRESDSFPLLLLGAPGVRLEGSVVRDSRHDGVVVDAADVRLSGCQISGSGRDGIRLRVATGFAVHDCNLMDNAGAGVHNITTTSADARFNWWGDPAGPTGPEGDGVVGPVDTSEFRTEPVEGGGG